MEEEGLVTSHSSNSTTPCNEHVRKTRRFMRKGQVMNKAPSLHYIMYSIHVHECIADTSVHVHVCELTFDKYNNEQNHTPSLYHVYMSE